MRHATDARLNEIDSLLDKIRALDGLIEKKRGIWYRNSRAFLHFHEDPAGLFADLKIDAEFKRFPVHSEREERALLRAIREQLGS